MPSKAFKTSEWDLNINLSIKISATDFPVGLIKTASILDLLSFGIYKPIENLGDFRTLSKAQSIGNAGILGGTGSAGGRGVVRIWSWG